MKQIFIVLLKIIYFLIIISLPIFLLYYWDFKYVSSIIAFLKISLWPLITLFFILYFKKNIGKFIDEVSELDIFGNRAKRDRQIPSQENQPSKDTDILKEYKGLNEQYKNIINSLGNNVSTLKQQLTNKEIELDFERIYNLIFGSQIFILKYLINADSIGLGELANYYSTVQSNNPALSTWGIDQYLKLLISSGLIEPITSGGFKITLKGRVFVGYIEQIRKYNAYKLL